MGSARLPLKLLREDRWAESRRGGLGRGHSRQRASRTGAPGSVVTLATLMSLREQENSVGRRCLPLGPTALGYICALSTTSSEKSQTTACVGECVYVCAHILLASVAAGGLARREVAHPPTSRSLLLSARGHFSPRRACFRGISRELLDLRKQFLES